MRFMLSKYHLNFDFMSSSSLAKELSFSSKYDRNSVKIFIISMINWVKALLMLKTWRFLIFFYINSVDSTLEIWIHHQIILSSSTINKVNARISPYIIWKRSNNLTFGVSSKWIFSFKICNDNNNNKNLFQRRDSV